MNVPKGHCPLCRELFSDHDPYRAHLNDVHGLFDDPGTVSRLPELIELVEEPDAEHEAERQRKGAARKQLVSVGAKAEDATERPDPGDPGEPAFENADGDTSAATNADTLADEHTADNDAGIPRWVDELVADDDGPAAVPGQRRRPWRARLEAARQRLDRVSDVVGRAQRLAPEVALRVRRLGEIARTRAVQTVLVAAAAVVVTTSVVMAAMAVWPAADDPSVGDDPAQETEVVTETADTAGTAVPAPPPAPPPSGQYVVEPGDTMSKIATRFGVPLDALVAANHIENPNLIFRGQVLTIPAAAQ